MSGRHGPGFGDHQAEKPDNVHVAAGAALATKGAEAGEVVAPPTSDTDPGGLAAARLLSAPTEHSERGGVPLLPRGPTVNSSSSTSTGRSSDQAAALTCIDAWIPGHWAAPGPRGTERICELSLAVRVVRPLGRCSLTALSPDRLATAGASLVGGRPRTPWAQQETEATAIGRYPYRS